MNVILYQNSSNRNHINYYFIYIALRFFCCPQNIYIILDYKKVIIKYYDPALLLCASESPNILNSSIIIQEKL